MVTNNKLDKNGVLQIDSVNSQFDEVNISPISGGLAQRISPTSYQVAGYFDEVTSTGVTSRLTKFGVLQVAGYFDEFNLNAAPSVSGYATGGTIVDITGYKVHIFNSSGTFATTSSWPSGRTIEYLVVAGGGGGYDGGGGAGGLLSASGITTAASTNYAVTVGGGGSTGANGGNSSLIGGSISVTSTGGGAAGDNAGAPDGASGGSGGGGGYGSYLGAGGAGIPGQGNDGSGAAGDYKHPNSGNGGGAGGTDTGYGAPGLVSNMLSFYSPSTITMPSYGFAWDNYTLSVDAGLPFQTDASIYLENSSDSTKKMFGRVISYSGTTLVCRLDRLDGDGTTPTLSGWNIKFDHAGGGRGYLSGGYSPPLIGGGGGVLGYGTYDYGGAPNSGGGGQYYINNGGSGVVMIKYAYP